MTIFHRSGFAALLAGIAVAAGLTAADAHAQGGTTAPTDAQVRDLQAQVQSLQQQLDKLKATRDPAQQRRMMEQNWRGMQDYMARMHERWGMGEPWMMGSGGMGCPVMGGGAGWPVPEGMTSESYRQQMQGHMSRMREQMNGIAQATDPAERQRLMDEHWRSMYQDMQTMRGMGWMWEGPMMGRGMMHGMRPSRAAPSPTRLPDPDSAGAKLTSTYCTQCHAAPQPMLHTAEEWTSVTERMHARMNGDWQGVKTPTTQEMDTILAYMKMHAR